MPMIALSDREFHTTLAALRLWELRAREAPTWYKLKTSLDDIATNGETAAALSADEIDALCIRLNTEPDAVPAADWSADGTALAPRPAGADARASVLVESPLVRPLLAEAVEAFADGFDSTMAGADSVNSADLVDWFATWRLKAKAALAAAPRPPSLAIIIEGGRVSDIVSDRPGDLLVNDLLVIDYDTEGGDGDDMSMVRQLGEGPNGDPQYVPAYVYSEGISQATIDLKQVAEDDGARDAGREAGWSYDRMEEAFTDGERTLADVPSWAELCRVEGIEI